MLRSINREHGYYPHDYERHTDTRKHEPQIGNSALHNRALDGNRVFLRGKPRHGWVAAIHSLNRELSRRFLVFSEFYNMLPPRLCPSNLLSIWYNPRELERFFIE